jgi:predicted amidohydrolase YtcJ
LEQNFLIALGTDFPVEKINPIYTFYAAVFRKNNTRKPLSGFQKNESLSRINALKGMTIWAALANFEENEKGSLEIGKSADMVVLNTEILSQDENDILKTKVIYTIIDGENVYNY